MAISGDRVAIGCASHWGGIYAGTSWVAVGVGEGVLVCVNVGIGVVVGGGTICVT